jgi:hypothetical protein
MIRELFLNLIKYTTPNGYEYLVYNRIPNAHIDGIGNRYVIVGDGPHTNMFTCHLDTYPLTPFSEPVTIIEEGDIIRSDGSTLLGADDKAGMTVMLAMIDAGVPGIYAFFIAEEIGLVGSDYAAQDKEWMSIMSDVKSVISFDRRGTSSIITHQRGMRTCSQSYATRLQYAFEKQGLVLKPDNTGSATDSLSFFRMNKKLQCTNISVGYGRVHSNDEYQDIGYLEKLCKAVTQMEWPIQ